MAGGPRHHTDGRTGPQAALLLCSGDTHSSASRSQGHITPTFDSSKTTAKRAMELCSMVTTGGQGDAGLTLQVPSTRRPFPHPAGRVGPGWHGRGQQSPLKGTERHSPRGWHHSGRWGEGVPCPAGLRERASPGTCGHHCTCVHAWEQCGRADMVGTGLKGKQEAAHTFKWLN